MSVARLSVAVTLTLTALLGVSVSVSAQQPVPPAPPAPAKFIATFKTTAGAFDVNCTRSLSPHGVDRFYQLISTASAVHYYDVSGFFRVVPGFVVQFGIAGSPTLSAQWVNATIPDDPVLISNTAGTISYATAGPDTRTTQLFVNLADNSFLDAQGFTPFCQVMGNGMSAVNAINAQYGELPDQDTIYAQGNAYLKANFPNLSYITAVTLKSVEL